MKKELHLSNSILSSYRILYYKCIKEIIHYTYTLYLYTKN